MKACCLSTSQGKAASAVPFADEDMSQSKSGKLFRDPNNQMIPIERCSTEVKISCENHLTKKILGKACEITPGLNKNFSTPSNKKC